MPLSPMRARPSSRRGGWFPLLELRPLAVEALAHREHLAEAQLRAGQLARLRLDAVPEEAAWAVRHSPR